MAGSLLTTWLDRTAELIAARVTPSFGRNRAIDLSFAEYELILAGRGWSPR
jgi:hypothetical protein